MNSWEADPEKYAELSKPFDSPEEAEKVAQAFLMALRALREQYRIAEMCVQYQIYVKMDDGIHALVGGGGWGNQLHQARLARRMFDREFSHLGKIIEAIMREDSAVEIALLTDPKVEP